MANLRSDEQKSHQAIVKAKELPRKEEYTYPRCEYKIEMKNSNVESGVYLFDNIKVIIK